MPNVAVDFAGQWIDSLGNDVYVKLVDFIMQTRLRLYSPINKAAQRLVLVRGGVPTKNLCG